VPTHLTRILDTLKRLGKPTRVGVIAKEAGLTPKSASGAARKYAEQGYLTRIDTGKTNRYLYGLPADGPTAMPKVGPKPAPRPFPRVRSIFELGQHL
jgi:hypothetical protein